MAVAALFTPVTVRGYDSREYLRFKGEKLNDAEGELLCGSNSIPYRYSRFVLSDYETTEAFGQEMAVELKGEAVRKYASWVETHKKICGETISMADDRLKGRFGRIYHNIGTYDGQTVDLKITISDWEESSKGNGIIGLRYTNGAQNKKQIGVVVFRINWIELTYQFLLSGTDTPLEVQGHTSYWDVDAGQGIQMNGGVTGLYYLDTCKLNYGLLDQLPLIHDGANQAGDGYFNPDNSFTETFSGSTFKRVFYWQGSTQSGSISHQAEAIVSLNGILEVRKTARRAFGSPLNREDEFHFTLDVQDPDGQPLQGHYLAARENEEFLLTFTAGQAQFTLKSDESIRIELPIGSSYQITEAADHAYQLTGKVNDNGQISTEEVISQWENTAIDGWKEYGEDSEIRDMIPVRKDQLISYDLHYSQCSSPLTVTDRLSPLAEFVRCSDDGIYDPASHSVIWKLGSPETPGQLSVTVRVISNEGFLKNRAEIASEHDVVTTEELINPIISKTYGPDEHLKEDDPVKIGQQITYQLNFGLSPNQKDAEVTIIDTLSPGLEYLPSSCNMGEPDINDRVLIWKLNDLLPDKAYALCYQAVVNDEALYCQHISNSAILRINEDRYPLGSLTNVLNGDLTVRLQVSEYGDHEKSFPIEVILSDPTIEGKYGELNFQQGRATVSLKDGEQVTACDLPALTEYAVRETEHDGHTVHAVNDDLLHREADDDVINGTIHASSISQVLLINRRPRPTGSLLVDLVTSGADSDPQRPFRIVLRLSQPLTAVIGDLSFTDGEAVFYLKDGESLRLEELPSDLDYVLRETDYDDYQVSIGHNDDSCLPLDEMTGTIRKDQLEAVHLSNCRQIPRGSLQVTLNTSGNGADPAHEFPVLISFSDSTINGTFGELELTGGEAVRMMKHGESLTVSGIKADTRYLIQEIQPDDYLVEINGFPASESSGSITANETAREDILNIREIEIVATGDENRIILPSFVMLLSAASAFMILRKLRKES